MKRHLSLLQSTQGTIYAYKCENDEESVLVMINFSNDEVAFDKAVAKGYVCEISTAGKVTEGKLEVLEAWVYVKAGSC